jgi:hypothetical protein
VNVRGLSAAERRERRERRTPIGERDKTSCHSLLTQYCFEMMVSLLEALWLAGCCRCDN